MRTILVAALLSLVFSFVAIAQDDSCRDVLIYSARNESVETTDEASAARVYDQYCENDSVRAGTQFGASLDAVVKAIPIKFGLNAGSSEERLKSFCKVFSSDYTARKAHYQAMSQVVNESTRAWLACKQLAGQGVLFKPALAKTQAVIEVSRTNAAPTTVQGITYDKSLLTCTVPNSDQSNKPLTAANDTNKTLKDDSKWTITCTRLSKAGPAGETLYPDADISVSTSRGTFLLPIPADAQLPYRWASQFETRLGQLSGTAAASLVEAGSDRCFVASGRRLQVCWGEADLSPNPGGVNPHVRQFAFTFARNFEGMPNVLPGINTRSAGNAPAVYEFTISPTGYSGWVNNMLTSGNAQDGTVHMSYLAIGRPNP
jgi:hypothetical protein